MAEEAGERITGATSWVFGTLPLTETFVRAGHQVQGHPALDEDPDGGPGVCSRVYASAEEAAARHRRGLVRLLEHTTSKRGPDLLRGLGNADKLALAGSPYPSVAALVADCRRAVLLDVVDAAGRQVRDEAAYAALEARAGAALEGHLAEVLAQVLGVLERWRRADKALTGRADLNTLPALTDMRAQLGRLMAPGFVGEAGLARLRRYRTYLEGIIRRRERLEEQVRRDRQSMERIADLQAAYDHRIEALAGDRPPGAALREVRWLLEEYRISLFAQELGTAVPVSDARIRKLL